MKPKLVFTLIIVALMFATLACLGGGQSGSPQEGSPDDSGLSRGTWVLVEIRGEEPVSNGGSFPTITFMDGQASGNASCNGWGASYSSSGDSLSFGEAETSVMLCEVSGVMEQEEAFIQMLGEAQRFEIQDNRLTIFTSSGETLVFQELGT